MKKLFVLDTNVLLHDHTCLTRFQDNDIVIPIVVLEELDKFKKGSDSINYQAREVIRELDKLSADHLFKDGVILNPEGGKLFIIVDSPRSELVDHAFSERKTDNRIIALAEQLKRERTDVEVRIVSKDINMRIKAKSVGVIAEDYKNDTVENIEKLYTGRKTIEGFSSDIINRFYEEPFSVPVSEMNFETKPLAHQYFVLKNGSSSVIARYNPSSECIERIYKKSAYSIEPRNSEQIFALDALTRPEIPLVTITGKAGTGKTLLALAAALEQRKDYHQIFLARPIVPLGNKDMGFLPGDIQSKLDPYMQPLWDNLSVIKHRFSQASPEYKRIQEMLESDKLHISPLAFIRGRSLEKIYFIVDEAQNLTPHEIKTIITRAGEGCKIVFTGDVYQIDTPYLDKHSNGLTYLVDHMKGQSLFAHTTLVKGERSQLAELASNLL